MQILIKDSCEWRKLRRLKDANHAHVSRERILVTFSKKSRSGIVTEWQEQYPNDGIIKVSKQVGDRHVYVNGSLVSMIKKFEIIDYSDKIRYPTDSMEESGIGRREIAIGFSDNKTYISDSDLFKDGKMIARGSRISVVGA